MTNEQFERLSALFYKKTGKLAPGKDSPLRAEDSGEDEVTRLRLWSDWIKVVVCPAAHDLLTELITTEAEVERITQGRLLLSDALFRVDEAEWLDMQLKHSELLRDCGILEESKKPLQYRNIKAPEGYRY